MATTSMRQFLDSLREAVQPEGNGPSDGRLLDAYIQHREDAAFAAIVQRHGPMVWGVCRRMLSNPLDAEDAFQATFLILIRKASSVSPRDMVANWLHGVAFNVCLKARAAAGRRKARELQVPTMPETEVVEQDVWRDLEPVLDQELNRLPVIYRTAIILCELEGKTRRDAARQLGIPEGTLSSRLTAGRAMLAKRLTRHGLAVSVGTLASVLSQKCVLASAPTAMSSSVIKAAALLAAGQAGTIPVRVAVLAEGVLKSMLLAKLKTAVAGLVMIAALSGLGGVMYPTQAGQPDAEAQSWDRESAAGGRPGVKEAGLGGATIEVPVGPSDKPINLDVGLARFGLDEAPKALFAPIQTPRKPAADESRTELIRVAEKFAVKAKGKTLKMEPEPLLRWPNPTRDIDDGATFLWTLDRRPQAMCCIWKFRGFGFAVHSLSHHEVAATFDGKEMWKCDVPGYTLKAFPDAPKPAASESARAKQLRDLARRFDCRIVEKEKENLRLMPQPVYACDLDGDKLTDLALFAYVQGTDPEVILVVETMVTEKGQEWGYALTRRSMLALEAELDGKNVWRVEVGAGLRTEPWFQSGLPVSK